MSSHSAREDYEVGYGKPPKRNQFQKGKSGNPSGRRKKPQDFDSVFLRELDLPLPIHENGKRRKISKHEAVVKQLANKAVSGDLRAIRDVMTLRRQALDRLAETQRNSPSNPKRTAKDLTDEELIAILLDEPNDPTPDR